MFVCLLFFPCHFSWEGRKITTKIRIISQTTNIKVILVRFTVSLSIYFLFFFFFAIMSIVSDIIFSGRQSVSQNNNYPQNLFLADVKRNLNSRERSLFGKMLLGNKRSVRHIRLNKLSVIVLKHMLETFYS